MISRLEQLFCENALWGWLALLFLLVLLIIEEKWRPARRFMKWVTAPPTCKKCGGTEFRPPSWWKPEMSFDSFSLKGAGDWCRLPLLPPQECVNCGELK